jgi:glycerate-2-kinase
MRRGLLLSAWTHRTPAGITATGRELRLLSLADRAAGLQFLQLALDRDGIDGTRLPGRRAGPPATC